MTEILDTILQGVLLGGLYALFAAGLALIFGVMRLVNLAHGDLIILAAYLILLPDRNEAGIARQQIPELSQRQHSQNEEHILQHAPARQERQGGEQEYENRRTNGGDRRNARSCLNGEAGRGSVSPRLNPPRAGTDRAGRRREPREKPSDRRAIAIPG